GVLHPRDQQRCGRRRGLPPGPGRHHHPRDGAAPLALTRTRRPASPAQGRVRSGDIPSGAPARPRLTSRVMEPDGRGTQVTDAPLAVSKHSARTPVDARRITLLTDARSREPTPASEEARMRRLELRRWLPPAT